MIMASVHGSSIERLRSQSSTLQSPPSVPRGLPPRYSVATGSWRSIRWRVSIATQRFSEIGEGTSEVQRLLIARRLGLPVE